MKKTEKIIRILKDRQLDAILVSDPYNIRYFSGFRGGTGYLFLSGKSQILLTDSRYTTQAEKESPQYEIITVSAEKPYAVWIKELAEREKADSIGFEDGVMIYTTVKKLEEALCGRCLVPLGEALNDCRQIKDKDELDAIRRAEEIGDRAFSHILDVIRPGMTEVDIALELEGFMRKAGAEGLSFETIVASGDNSAMPHAIPGSKKVQKGELITMDFGCVWNGYCSDMTRTVVLGKASGRQKQIYETVLQAQLRALEGIRSGISGKQADALARDVIEKAGFGAYFGHALGHSLGLFIHEGPRLSSKETALLQEGMVVTVEPGIYLPGEEGVRIEDLVEITKEGCINYTKSPKKLIEL